jgi:ElaB/YqjD/DUF883 family membrane-anchored ribosome-binding protein
VQPYGLRCRIDAQGVRKRDAAALMHSQRLVAGAKCVMCQHARSIGAFADRFVGQHPLDRREHCPMIAELYLAFGQIQ